MIHPSTELRFISPEVGYGVFATDFIPKGTITYVEDDLEVRIPESQFNAYAAPIREVLDKYSYIDADGVRIMSWDFAKYVNHNCNFNSISTGYGFEIAIRDIHPGEELTDEYGIFNLEYPMKCYCGSYNCRGEVSPDDFDTYYEDWDRLILGALPDLKNVDQPLWSLLDPKLEVSVEKFLQNPKAYTSVYTYRRRKFNAAV
jgi:uncharacterized protein